MKVAHSKVHFCAWWLLLYVLLMRTTVVNSIESHRNICTNLHVSTSGGGVYNQSFVLRLQIKSMQGTFSLPPHTALSISMYLHARRKRGIYIYIYIYIYIQGTPRWPRVSSFPLISCCLGQVPRVRRLGRLHKMDRSSNSLAGAVFAPLPGYCNILVCSIGVMR